MAFDLASVLRNVSESDAGREQIQYIPLNQIDEDPNNFYQLEGIPQLADNISLCGLQQPIRVRQKEDGRYIIVSGHRRRAALEMLVADGYEKFREAACIVEQDEVSPALQQLRLIYANANTRKMTSAEISQQAEQVEKLLYQLKEEGYDFPGRMRDHVAEAVQVSKSKLARLKVIREKLLPVWHSCFEKNLLVESTAYELAQLPEKWQSVIYGQWGVHPGSLYANDVKTFKVRFEKVAGFGRIDSGGEYADIFIPVNVPMRSGIQVSGGSDVSVYVNGTQIVCTNAEFLAQMRGPWLYLKVTAEGLDQYRDQLAYFYTGYHMLLSAEL